MKTIKTVFFVLALFSCFSINCIADCGHSWYIIKKGNCVPDFPPDADFISEHNGYYLDKDSADNGKKVIYLTFDAGYENGNIEKILDIMKDEEVTGAFFILSNLINKNPNLINRMVNEGHLVCNHTSNHKDLTVLSDEEILENLRVLEEKYESCTGLKMNKIFRFPEGKYSRKTIELLDENGYKTVFWSMAYDDWDNSRQHNTDVAKNKLMSTTHEGAILLLHPTSSTNVKILPELIKEWKAQGYVFGSLNDI